MHSQVCQRPQPGSLRAPGRGPVFLLLGTCGSDGSNLDAVHPEMCSLGDWADRSQIAKEATMPLHYSAARYEHSLRTKRILRLAMEKLLAYESKCVGIGSTCVASWIHRIAEQEYESNQCCCAGVNLHSIPKQHPARGRLRPSYEVARGKKDVSEKYLSAAELMTFQYFTFHI